MFNERKQWINNLRVLATFCVIFLHASSPLLDHAVFTQDSVGLPWLIGNLYEGSVRFCVPVFLMLSGALLLGHDQPFRIFIKRRYTRVAVPLLFWSLVYIVYYGFSLHGWDNKQPLEILQMTSDQLRNGVAFHMWYVYMILGLYLFIPILNLWIKNSTEKQVLFFLGMWLYTILAKMPVFSFLSIGIDLSPFSGYIGYLLLGYYLSVTQFKSQYILAAALGLIIAGNLFTIFASWRSSLSLGKTDSEWYEYLSINVIVSSTGIFLFFKNLAFPAAPAKITRLVNLVARHSYGIYLIHVLVLRWLSLAQIDCYLISPVFGTPITAILCLYMSLAFVWLAGKLPYGKYFAG